MALTKAQSRQLILDWKAEADALDAQIATAQAALRQAKSSLDVLAKQREPMTEEIRAMVQRHKRLFIEDV